MKTQFKAEVVGLERRNSYESYLRANHSYQLDMEDQVTGRIWDVNHVLALASGWR